MKKIILNQKLFLPILVFIFSVFAFGALAREVAWPDTPLGTPFPEAGMNLLVKYFYEWGICLGGFAAFIALVIAGSQYLASVGNPAMMREAKDRIISAGLGLGLLLGSWLILNTINPQFTHFPPLAPIGTKIITPTIPELPTDQDFPECSYVEVTIRREGTETIESFGTIGTECIDLPAEGFEPIETEDTIDITFYSEENKPCVSIPGSEPCYIGPGQDGQKGTDDDIEYRRCRGTIAFYGRESCEDEVIQIVYSSRNITGFNRDLRSCKMITTVYY